jgi:hypothetical protein
MAGMNAQASVRVRTWLLTLGAIGEMAVGALIAVFPSVGTLLVGALIDSAGRVVTRMVGVALLALGLTWWLGRSDAACLARNTPGFVLYNIGVGALFVMAARSASQPLVPWIVAIVHLAAGATFVAIAAMAPSATTAAKD